MRHVTICTVIAAFMLNLAFAPPVQAGAGGQPNGKPFQALRMTDAQLQTQIDQMQVTIDGLLVDLTSLDARITVNEQFIAELQAQNAGILARLAELQGLIDGNTQKLAEHSAEIATLQQDLAVNTAKIAYLEGQIADLNVTLQTKQDILNGTCPAGYFLRGIEPDGGILCGLDTTGSNGLQQTIVSHTGTVGGKYDQCVEDFLGICLAWQTIFPGYAYTNYCPAGYVLTGGGVDFNHNGHNVDNDVNKPVGNGWYVKLNNYGDVELAVSSYAVCVKVEP